MTPQDMRDLVAPLGKGACATFLVSDRYAVIVYPPQAGAAKHFGAASVDAVLVLAREWINKRAVENPALIAEYGPFDGNTLDQRRMVRA